MVLAMKAVVVALFMWASVAITDREAPSFLKIPDGLLKNHVDPDPAMEAMETVMVIIFIVCMMCAAGFLGIWCFLRA